MTPVTSQSYREKYDLVYALWKNAFEDNKIRTLGKVSATNEGIKCSRNTNIRDVLDIWPVPMVCPSYTELNAMIQTKEAIKNEIFHRKLERRLSMLIGMPS